MLRGRLCALDPAACCIRPLCSRVLQVRVPSSLPCTDAVSTSKRAARIPPRQLTADSCTAARTAACFAAAAFCCRLLLLCYFRLQLLATAFCCYFATTFCCYSAAACCCRLLLLCYCKLLLLCPCMLLCCPSTQSTCTGMQHTLAGQAACNE